jgi:hypothetical protein
MFKGGSDSIKHETNQPHVMKDNLTVQTVIRTVVGNSGDPNFQLRDLKEIHRNQSKNLKQLH